MRVDVRRIQNEASGGLFIFLTVVVILVLMLSSCSSDDDPSSGSNGNSSTIDNGSSSGNSEGNTDTAYNEDDILDNSEFTSVVTIDFGSTVTITNPLSASGVSASETGGDVTITSSAEGVEYKLSGTTTNGSVKIYSDTKFKLTLNGVTITNTNGPAINVQSTKRAFVFLTENTTSTLTDGSGYTTSGDEDMKAAFFSEGQLIFSGAGTLSVKGKYKHAICSDEYIRVISGVVTVTGAVSDGIHTNEAFVSDGGEINVSASGDGIQCEQGYIVVNDGTITVNAYDKGISAAWDTDNTIDPYVTINGGTVKVTTTTGEGIESKSTLTINNGTVTTSTPDDGINAKKALYINGGVVYANSSGNDAIDSNGTLTITGGTIVAAGTKSPEEGFDCDHNTFKVTGGIMIGMGGATSSPTANVCTQPSVIMGAGNANQIIHIESSSGDEALTFMIPRSYSTMLFSSSKLSSGTSYVVYTGGSVANGVTVNGLYTSGTYSPGSQSTTFTISGMVTKIGGSIGPG